MSTNTALPTVDGYKLLEKLGQGGMGAVYKAKQLSMDRIVAVKILPPKMGKNAEFLNRFHREARLAGRLNHENVVNTIGVGNEGNYHYISMEFVEGKTVQGLLDDRGHMPEREVLSIARQVLNGLKCAHQHDMVHRDIKPDNIMIDQQNVAKVMDLGLACTVEEDTSLTQTGMALGTPHYASPEQARGDGDVDVRSDFYSLGATMYHMVTGSPVYDGTSGAVIMAKHIMDEPESPQARRPDLGISDEMTSLIALLMEKDRNKRPSNADAALEAVDSVLSGQRPAGAPAPARGTRRTGRHAPVRRSSRRRRTTGLHVPITGVPGDAPDRSYESGGARRGARSGSGPQSPVGNSKGMVAIGAAAAAAILLGVVALSSGSGDKPRTKKRRSRTSKTAKKVEQPARDVKVAEKIAADPAVHPVAVSANPGQQAGAASREAEARAALAEAREWASTHPNHLGDQIKSFQGILSRFDGTAAANEARTELNKLNLRKVEAERAELERQAQARAQATQEVAHDPVPVVAETAPGTDAPTAKAVAPKPEVGLSRKAYAALRAKSAEALKKRDFEAAAVPLREGLKEAKGKPPTEEIKASLADLALAGQLMDQAEKNAPLMKGKTLLYMGKTNAEVSGFSSGKVYIKMGERGASAELPVSLRNKAVPAFEVVKFFDAKPDMPKEKAAQARVAFLFALEELQHVVPAMNRLPSELHTQYAAKLEALRERKKAEALEVAAEKELARIKRIGMKPKNPDAVLTAVAAFKEKYKTTEVLAENQPVLKEITAIAQEATGRPPEDMVVVAGGEFLYGPEKEKCTLPGFKIDRHEVSNGDYALFVKWILGSRDLDKIERRIGEVRHPEGPRNPMDYVPLYMPEVAEFLELVRAEFKKMHHALEEGGGTELERKELHKKYEAFRAKHEGFEYYFKKYRSHKEHWAETREVFGGKEKPVTHIHWYAAWSFAKWAGKRLPTAKEWDKAARGTDGRNFPAGKWTNDMASAYNGGNGYEFKDEFETLGPVNSLPKGASPYGCLNMSGNVWEWIGEAGECRGGSWKRCRFHLDLNCRDDETRPGTRVRDSQHGFRCAKDL